MNEVAARTGKAGSRNVPIVGLGASAGGLRPLSTFLHAMPADAGLAHVVMVHLEPGQHSLMPELLGRESGMTVVEARDGQALEADHVYVIPPNREVSVANATLRVMPITERRGLRTPIDTFFRSLADACGTRCAGIVLSGTGSDGAAGLREIKANGGLTVVQDPATAAHDGMPQAAIATGVVDLVCPARQMPRAIEGFLRTQPEGEALESAPLPESMVDAVLSTLHAQRGTDFRHYRPTTLARRIQRRIDLNPCTEPAQYPFQLRDDPGEVDLLVRELLIGVTGFYRDRAAFDELERLVIAPLVARCRRDEPLRIWVPGCSTGAEAYSIAILLAEQQRLQGRHCQVQLFASDVHSDALEFARAGCFRSGIAADLAPELLTRYFSKDASGRLIAQNALRDTITFARHDLLADPPFSRLYFCGAMGRYLKIAQGEPNPNLMDIVRDGLASRVRGAVKQALDSGQDTEELETSNEELQSSNAELKASRDALQAVNEELSTGNAQLQEKLEDLEQANADLQNFLDSSDLAMLFLDRELRVRRYTHEATALFKLLPAGRGRHLSDISSSLTDQDLSDIAREVLQTLVPHEATVRGHDGRWYLRRVLACRTRDERPGGVVVTYSDVTGLLESERLAGERLAELEAIYEQAPVGLAFLDPDLRIERVNAQLARFDGLTREAHLGQRPGELLPQSVGGRVQAHLESVHASGEALIDAEIHGELAGTPGVWRDWQASYYPVRAADHTLLGINAMVQDVTRRKQIERYLSAAREVSVALMNASSEAQLIEDSLAAVAKTFEARICEYWERESGGDRFRIRYFHVPDATAERRQRLEHAFDELRLPAGDTLVGGAWSQARARWVEDVTEHPGFVRAAEAQELGLASGFALPVGSGDAVYGVMCFFTGRRLAVSPALENAVEALGRDVGHTIRRIRDSQRLRDADERKSRFLSVLGHELRNPLSSIANATELLASGDTSMHDHALLVLRSGVATTSRLLDDLLDLERIERGKITLQRTRVNLSGPIRQAVWAVHEAVDGKHQQLSIQLPQAPLLVDGDAMRLEQAIVNLLQNAVKYTPERGFIEIAAYPEGEHAVVQVSDSGIGIEAQELGVIFEPFVQLPGDSSTNDGLGVGLSLVKQLVVLHGGRVSAHSKGPGRGTTFIIRLPRASHDEPREPPAGDGVREGADTATVNVRVLVVDDNTASAETLALILADWGCEVRMAANAEQALEIAAQLAPEILVLDLGLPDIDGFELARRLDAAAAHPRLTIALSGFGDEQARGNAAQAGFDHFMVKPARLEQLRALLIAFQSRRDDDREGNGNAEASA